MRHWFITALTVSLLLSGMAAGEGAVNEWYVHEAVSEKGMPTVLPSADELRSGYAARVMAQEQVSVTNSLINRSKLTAMECQAYDLLRAAVNDIADGRRAETVILVDPAALGVQIEWTEADFSQPLFVDGYFDYDAFYNGIREKYEQKLNMEKVLDALMMDDPYGFYWLDKHSFYFYNNPWDVGMSGYYDERGLVLVLDGTMDVGLPVDLLYAAEEPYMADVVKTGAGSRAAENARMIVNSTKGMDDMARMTAYMQQIRALSEYNHPAAAGMVNNSAPWQLISVFDGDPSTTVVCEGFSKAFLYLCDLTDFYENDLEVYCVTGDLDGGAHMWNIVRTEGANYLVDITNCVTGGTHTDSLFFSLPVSGSVQDGYRMRWAEAGYVPQIFLYEYDQETRALYSERELTLGELPAQPRLHWLNGGVCSDCGKRIDLTGMNTIRLPEGLMVLGEEALRGTAAEVIVLPESVMTIGDQALAECDALKYVVLPAGAEALAEELLSGSEALEIILTE